MANYPTPHIHAKPGDFGKTVLMPGDPLRSKFIAENFLENARKDCERFMGTKVFLQTWVRVKENWRDSDFMISNFGYHKD